MRLPRVVVVDDRRDSATFLSALLTAAGFESAHTSQEQAAIDSVRDEQVAVVLCAYSGDGTPSAALIRRIRSRSEPAIHDVGIVALVDEPWAADRAAQAGADAVLVRPVHSSRLLTVINQTAAVRPLTRASRRAAI